jgi:SPP1 family predicted phage head-tail adaptor
MARTIPLKRPYKDKGSYDPGRFRHMLEFKAEQSTPDGAGGTVVATVTVLTTKAVREKISEHNQLAIQAGASWLTNDIFFIIRNRQNFYPEKDMIVVSEGKTYTVRAVIELDQPVKYIKLLCSGSD